MTWLWLYLAVGVANAAEFTIRSHRRYGPMPEGDWHLARGIIVDDVVMFVLFVVGWPLQLAYFLITQASNGIEWPHRW
jgi:hypothetical protein